jgi:hypothetical protein
MAVITEIIQEQAFEKVANKIAEILTTEIAYQQDKQDFEDTVEVFLERIEPFDKNEDVMVSVAFREAKYEGYTTSATQGEYVYFVDLFCSGYGERESEPSIVAKNKLMRYLGIIRYVLSSPKYLTLGFEPGLIGGKYIKLITLDTDYSNFGNHSNYDGSYIRFARIIFLVRVQENNERWNAIPLQGNNTNITYDDTALGTQLILNN